MRMRTAEMGSAIAMSMNFPGISRMLWTNWETRLCIHAALTWPYFALPLGAPVFSVRIVDLPRPAVETDTSPRGML